jgi:hypothetical protein
MEKPPISFPPEIESADEISEKKKGLIRRLGELTKRNKGITSFILASVMGSAMFGDKIGMEVSSLVLSQEEGHKVTQSERQIADKISHEIGPVNMWKIERLNSIKSEAERAQYIEEHDKEPLRVSGFDKSGEAGMKSEEVEAIIESLPKAYRFDAPAVSYEDKKISMQRVYGKGMAKDGAYAAADADSNKIIFGPMARNDFETSLFALFHEEGHLKDWDTDKALTLDERMELVQEVIDRVNASDRYQSPEVEAIESSDEQYSLNYKTKEYWAEITAAYFSPGEYKLLSSKDRNVVEGFIHKTDPHFGDSERTGVTKTLSRIFLRRYPDSNYDPFTGKKLK